MTLNIEGLSFSYGTKEVLQELTLILPLEGITALSGPSGCGKTTLLHLIAGLLTPDRGRISGVTPGNAALLFQENRLFPWRSARQHITDVLPRAQAGRAEELLALVELSEAAHLLPDAMSGGMRRRLALGRCLALEAPLLLLDEPFTGVDLPCAQRILERLQRRGVPVLLTSHQSEVLALCGRVVQLKGSSPRE